MTQTLADWLIRRFPTAKKQTLRRMVEDRRVRVNGYAAKRYLLPIGEADVIEVDERSAAVRRPPPHNPAALVIIYEDVDLLVVHKPAGLLTSTVPDEPRPTLLAEARLHVADQNPRARIGLIHRLDRDASGLLVFSKTDAAYQSLKTQFYHHDVERAYHAVVRGTMNPPQGRIESRLVEWKDGKVRPTRLGGKGQEAVTNYETVRSAGKRSLVRVTLHTGRKHQIRVHLTHAGHPIVGDAVYGSGETTPPKTPLMLIATRLGLTHPTTGKKLVFDLPIPEEMERLVPAPATVAVPIVAAAAVTVSVPATVPAPLATQAKGAPPLPRIRGRGRG